MSDQFYSMCSPYDVAHPATTEDQFKEVSEKRHSPILFIEKSWQMALAVGSSLAQYSHVNPDNVPYAQAPYHAPDSTYDNHVAVVQTVPSADGYQNLGAEPRAMRIIEVQLHSEEMASATTTQTLCTAICQYPNNSGTGICGVPITCRDVSAHFKHVHGIRDMNELDKVVCKWGRCFMELSRKSFARHIRERHLNHSRKRGCSAR
ncbi:hypothetical protein JVU11DRAFT_290 [Chiua virens]|nr:hypothetical protein JVU11DRAFT_290 [Chiua virens]